MGKLPILTTLLTIIYGYTVLGRLITTPFNQAILEVWWNTSMNCSSTLGSNNISWYFIPVGESTNATIASASIVYPAFTQLYWIDQPTGFASNLIIRSPNNSTTGTFTCADSEMVAHAQVLLLYGFPVSSNASDNLIYGEVISLSCAVTYLGNPFITPIFYLYDTSAHSHELLDKNTSPELNKSNSRITATATFYRAVSCPKFLQMHCIIYYGKPEGSLLPGSADNAPGTSTSARLLSKNVSCALTADNVRIVGVISGAMLYFGGALTCQVTSDPPVNYSWSDLTYGNSINGPHLTVWHSGSYQCTASVYISGRWYSASKTVYDLTVEKLSSTARPLYGPIAGGTRVTVTFKNWSKQIDISAVYLGGILKTTILLSNRSNNSFVMTTPNATTSLIGQPLPITIEFTPGPYNISTNLSFTYQGNPEITGISPSSFVVTGGTLVTATGTQLSSVANPLIQVTIVIERGFEKNITKDVSFESCEVVAEDSSKMTCRMPTVNIPEDFLKVLDLQYHNRSTRDTNSMTNHLTADNLFPLSRHKRYLIALSLPGPNGTDRIVIYVGFILDGYRKYENINDVLPETRFLFHSAPEINSTKDILEYDANKEEFISIEGKHMQRGCRMNDYLVQVSGDVCENNNLQDNQLSCRPPEVKPTSTLNDTIYCDQHLSVTITLGFKQYHYACLTYTDQSSAAKIALIIGLTVGLAGFFLFLTILIVCVVRCCSRKSSKQNDNHYNSEIQEIRNPHYDNVIQLQSRQDDVYLRPQCRDSILPNEG